MHFCSSKLCTFILVLFFRLEVVLSFWQSGFSRSRYQSKVLSSWWQLTDTRIDKRLFLSLIEPGTPRNSRFRPPFTQVISDVDDTLKSSGGVNVGGVALGGIDVQYERGDFYPGVGEFMLGMSLYGLPKEDVTSPAKIAILTARAEEFKAALEIKEDSKLAVALRSAGVKAGIDGWGVRACVLFL